MGVVSERLYNGIVKENATFVQVLGMCPTLAVTTSAINGIGMGLSATVVLIGSNVVISLLKKVIPDEIRIPAYITVIATLVTVLQFLLQAYLPDLNKSLGIFIPLIVVNCIILGRAEAYANKNSVGASFFDGLGMGLGFTVSLAALGIIREFLGTGKVFGAQITPDAFQPALIMILAPGGFFTLGILMAILNQRKLKKAKAK
ncbi:electron transport complex protein RnfE [Clostridium tetanomorphum]|nr:MULTISPECIES: electron transport complex subunit E [Clostridium]7ZC6_E Chain E, RnfE [Clostridium tetanomorphum]KAJ52775.1 electron transport complex RsxE subunit [Clostridium tetanomorphum DSM 665]MBP1865358.1 electron transport complex protein RnfE [Clostridium tetanomorphum]NRS84875.1 electron transport complex protein RnfE [Clostridium tetanomorphum]NRZ98092.1 electron transport complex protein RnfE [Clostridium tetanomorphum]SQB91610.1 electron transport complex RsxE subunit [Clostrid